MKLQQPEYGASVDGLVLVLESGQKFRVVQLFESFIQTEQFLPDYGHPQPGLVTPMWNDQPIIGMSPIEVSQVLKVDDYLNWKMTGSQLDAYTQLLAVVRKNQHIELCATRDVEETQKCTGFDNFHLQVASIPDFDPCEVDTSVRVFHQDFYAPLFIVGMTGGVLKGRQINLNLAAAAAKFGIPMGVGSQRMALENDKFAALFRVKDHAPNLFLIGNIGISQLQGSPESALEYSQRAVEQIQADALAIHVNVLQEMVQPEGDKAFCRFWHNISYICANLGVPVVVKEVGSGFDIESALRLVDAGVSAIDVGGRGGTSWGYLEGLRGKDQMVAEVGKTFRDWGIPTAFSLAGLEHHRVDAVRIATGGIRNGLMVAKACGLGANLVGVGLPLMKAALVSEDEVTKVLDRYLRELRIAMLLSGAKSVGDLASKLVYAKTPYEQQLPDWMGSRGKND